MKKNTIRPDWDSYFLEIAATVAKRATCIRWHIGAVIVRDKRILATGYNGAPAGMEHCDVTGCLREQMGIPSGERHELCRGLHAEQNAIIQAAVHGVSIRNSKLYCTHEPCTVCSKMIINAGIKEVVVQGEYPDSLARKLLREGGVKVTIHKD